MLERLELYNLHHSSIVWFPRVRHVHVQIMLKSAEAEGIEMRVRRCQLASALVAFSQGVAFFHAGDEILRSKSLDRDSYNSGHPLTQQLHSVTPLHA